MTYGKSKRTAAPLDDPQLNTDFTYNFDSCVVQGSREDRDTTPTGQGGTRVDHEPAAEAGPRRSLVVWSPGT
ncbi:unnamed protein product [Macrosiphum euphorbiae]|uniref:Uncharacterized protein n=1 Tax=Macrosiphum euphorbiae TaxID=13131 RepID=A0AAV0XYC5_9HEMI|nr:unnamed protein product [Macrosiphum euphorbiae]